MYLSKNNLDKIGSLANSAVSAENIFSLPEKVLQFGTGVLLRALPDYIIDRANKKNLFNGRIVIVKSTASGDAGAFDTQDGLFTVCLRGVEKDKKIIENHIVSSVSRVLAASSQWDAVLQLAASPHMQVIISNTTEVGITYVKEDVLERVPESFPGKLVAFLYRRFIQFNGDATKGMVVIPTELIPGNADKLLSIALELARQNNLGSAFEHWLAHDNFFCNSLVDRIVPGKPRGKEQEKFDGELGYKDNLLVVAEVYALWAIQTGNERVREILSFALEEEGVVVAPDIHKFRELKLRLLNGPHTFSCGLAFLAGFTPVKDALADPCFFKFVKQLMFREIIPAVTGDGIRKEEAEIFAAKVLDRFKNNFIDHRWLSICLQYSSKMRLRNEQVIIAYMHRTGNVPRLMAMGMAAHILFMKATPAADGKYYGELNGNHYQVEDQNAALYAGYWQPQEAENVVNSVLSDPRLWGDTFSGMINFKSQVSSYLATMMQSGVMITLEQYCNETAS